MPFSDPRLLLEGDAFDIRLSMQKLLKLVDDSRVANLPYKEQFTLAIDILFLIIMRENRIGYRHERRCKNFIAAFAA